MMAMKFQDWCKASGARLVRATSFTGPRFVGTPCSEGDYLADLNTHEGRKLAVVYEDESFMLLTDCS